MTMFPSTGVHVVPSLVAGLSGHESIAGPGVTERFAMPSADVVAQEANPETKLSDASHVPSVAIENAEAVSTVGESGFGRFLRPALEGGRKMDAIRAEVKELGDGTLNNTETMLRLLNVQVEMQTAAMGLEMVSKTVEMGTNSFNTLARTQT